MEKLADVILRFRWLILGSILIVSGLAVWEAKRDLKFDFSTDSLFLSDDPERDFVDEFQEIFGEDDGILMPLFSRNSGEIFTIEFLKQLKIITREIGKLDHIDRSMSIINSPYIKAGEDNFTVKDFMKRLPRDEQKLAELREIAVGHNIYRNQIISADGKTLGMIIEFEPKYEDVDLRRPILHEINRIIEEGVARAEAAEPDAGKIEWHIAGIPEVEEEYSRILREDTATFVILSFICVAILLLLVFRNAHGIYIPLGAVGFAVLWTVALMALFDEKINVISNAIPSLLLTIGVADSIHILSRYYEEVGNNLAKREALRSTIKHIGLACFLTSTTTAVGFISLYTAHITLIKNFGLFAGIGVLLAYIVNITWMPAMLSLHGEPTRGIKEKLDHGLMGRFMAACGHATINHKLPIILVGLGILVFSIIGASMLKIESHMMEELPDYNPVSVSNTFAETHMTGIIPKEFSIAGEPGSMKNPDVLRAVDQLQRFIEEDPAYISKTMSLVDMLKEMNQAFHDGDPAYYVVPESRELVAQYLLLYESGGNREDIDRYINFDYSRLRLSAFARDFGTAYHFDFRDKINEQIKGTFPEQVNEVRMTGTSVIASTALDNLINDMLTSVLTAFFFIFVMVVMLFRSVKIGAISMIPTALPTLLTLGFMGVAEIYLRTSTVIIFSVSMGIAVDNTIHFIARFRSEILKDWDYPAAIMRTSLSTGRAIVFTSIILILGFSVMGTSDFLALQNTAILGGATLLTALFASILILPVCLLIFKPYKQPKEAASE
jgi:uncharacterized protein